MAGEHGELIGDLQPNSSNVTDWISRSAAENANGGPGRFAMGGTNIIDYAPTTGALPEEDPRLRRARPRR